MSCDASYIAEYICVGTFEAIECRSCYNSKWSFYAVALNCGSDKYLAKQADEDNYIHIFGRTISGADVTKWFSLLPANPEERVYNDLILHDPKFWQVPKLWWGFFWKESGESSFLAFTAYTKAMLWKAESLLLLTTGYWTEPLIDQFQVRYRSSFASFSNELRRRTRLCSPR